MGTGTLRLRAVLRLKISSRREMGLTASLRVLHDACPPSPSPAAGFTSVPSDSADSPRQAQPKHCPLRRGSGCSPNRSGTWRPGKEQPGSPPLLLGELGTSSAARGRVIPGCKHDPSTRTRRHTPRPPAKHSNRKSAERRGLSSLASLGVR